MVCACEDSVNEGRACAHACAVCVNEACGCEDCVREAHASAVCEYGLRVSRMLSQQRQWPARHSNSEPLRAPVTHGPCILGLLATLHFFRAQTGHKRANLARRVKRKWADHVGTHDKSLCARVLTQVRARFSLFVPLTSESATKSDRAWHFARRNVRNGSQIGKY